MDEDKVLGGADWASSNNIELRLNQTVAEVIPNEATIVVEDKNGNSERQTADFLVVATGASPAIPPITGVDVDGIYTLRSMADAKLIKAASHDQRVVIIGTGFMGLEVASALAQAGTTSSITVVGQDSRVMGNIVSETVSNALIKLHEEKGINFVFDATVNEITKVDRGGLDNEEDDQAFSNVGGVTLASGEHLDADIVVLGTGVSPRTEILSEVNASNGIEVDAHLQLRDGVYALGDIAKASNQMGRMRIEHWRVALQHGMVTAAAILGDDSVESFEARIPFFWTMQYGRRAYAIAVMQRHLRSISYLVHQIRLTISNTISMIEDVCEYRGLVQQVRLDVTKSWSRSLSYCAVVTRRHVRSSMQDLI